MFPVYSVLLGGGTMKSGSRGFLLLELLVCMLLLLLLLNPLQGVYQLAVHSWQSARLENEAVFNVRSVFTFISRDLRQAQSFMVTDSGRRLELTAEDKVVCYYTVQGELRRALYRNNLLQNVLALTGDVGSLEFSAVSDRLVSLKLTLKTAECTSSWDTLLGLRVHRWDL